MSWYFYPGQRVVCVDASPTNDLGIEELIYGAVYVLAWVGVHPLLANELCVHLKEITVRPATYELTGELCFLSIEELERLFGTGSAAFRARRFRPLTDISELEKLLTSTPHDYGFEIAFQDWRPE